MNLIGKKEQQQFIKASKIEADLNYDIQSYNIEIKGTKVAVEVTFNKLMTTTPSFRLSHAYPVHKVTNSRGESLLFLQCGDFVHVYSDDTKKITFFYELKGLKNHPIYSQYLQLTSQSVWYPQKSVATLYEVKALFEGNAMIPTSQSIDKYSFTLKIDEPIITNLKKHDLNIYRGDISSLYVLKPRTKYQNVLDKEVYFPMDWNATTEQLQQTIQRINSTYEELAAIVGEDTLRSNPNKIVFDNNISTILQSSSHDDIFLFRAGGLYQIETESGSIPKKVIKAFLNGNEQYGSWEETTGDLLAVRNGYVSHPNSVPQSLHFKWVLHQEDPYLSEQIKRARNVYKMLAQVNRSHQDFVLQKWYKNRDHLQDDWTLIEPFVLEGISNAN